MKPSDYRDEWIEFIRISVEREKKRQEDAARKYNATHSMAGESIKKMYVEESTPVTDEQYKYLMESMKKRNKPKVTDTRRFKLEDYRIPYSYRYSIPFLGGRPLRGKIINTDDIITLNVAFLNSKSLDEFLRSV